MNENEKVLNKEMIVEAIKEVLSYAAKTPGAEIKVNIDEYGLGIEIKNPEVKDLES